MPEQYRTDECRSCHNPVIWAVSTGDKPMPVDPEPAEGGNIRLEPRGAYCLAALVGVAADEDDESRLDDSGRGTAQRAARPPAARPRAARPTAQRAAAPPLPTDGPRPYTPAQRAKLMANFGEVGVADRTERLDICSRIVGRELSSANDLSFDEAKRVIDALEDAAKSDNPILALAELTAQPAELSGDADA